MKPFFVRLKEKAAQLFSRRSFKSGTLTASISAAVIVLVLLLNALLGLLPVSLTELDLTQVKLYTLSDYTQTYLKALTDDVTVYVIAETGTEDPVVEKTLGRYDVLSEHIHIEHVDPILKPTFVAQYTDEELANGSLILVSDRHPDRPYVLDYNDLGYRSFTKEEESYLTMIEGLYGEDARIYYETQVGTVMYDAEKQITAGIDYVLSDRLPQYYAISGHGGNGIPSELADLMEMANIQLHSLDLATVTELPKEIDGMLLQAPETDFSERELSLLRQYLASGGTLILTTSYDKIEQFSELAKLLAEYGLSAGAQVVMETDPEYCYYNTNTGTRIPTCLVPQSNADHPFTTAFSVTRRLCIIEAHAIKKAETLPVGVTVTDILSTTDGGALFDPETQKQVEGTKGKQTVAVDATKSEANGKSSRVIWFSSAKFLSSEANSASGSNYTYFLTTLSVLTGKNTDFPIDAVALSDARLQIGEHTAVILPIVLMAVIPMAVIVPGIVVCVKRRRR